jgi:D-glycero-D-manno-heptose 1,7-bisphosphate phosphatase
MVSEHAAIRAVFLDLDGVLTVPEFRDGHSYAPRRLENFRVYAEVADSASTMKKAGFRLVVVTNQPDVGHGRLVRSVVEEMHRQLAIMLPVDAIEACYRRHGSESDCASRSPACCTAPPRGSGSIAQGTYDR